MHPVRFRHTTAPLWGGGAILVLLLASAAGAQNPVQNPIQGPVPDPVHEQVVVTAHAGEVPYRTAARSVIVLGRDEIRRLPAHSIADLLAYVSSVDVRSRGAFGTQADFSIRGGTFGQALILVDGFRLNDAQSGHHNADIPVPVGEIDRIEVLLGPGSSIYGADAFGGIVNVITRRGSGRRDVSVAAGQFGLAEGTAAMAGSRNGIEESAAVAASRSGGFEIDRDFRTLSVSSRTTFRGGTRLWASHLAKDFGANGFYGPALSTETTGQTLFVIDGRLPARGGWKGEWQGGYRTHGDRFLYDSTRAGTPSRHRTHAVQGSVRLQRQLAPGTHLTVGGEAGGEAIRSTNLGDHDLNRTSGFAEVQQRVGSRGLIYPGVRVDRYSTFGTAVSPALAATAWLPGQVKLTGSVGRAFRVPTFTERFYSDPNNRGTASLLPERAWAGEGGVDWLGAGPWSAGLTAFHRRDRETIDFVRGSTRERWQAANVGRVETTGVETSVRRRLAASGVVSARYTWIEAAAERPPVLSKYVLEYARHSLGLSAGAALPGGFELGQRIDYRRRRSGVSYWAADARVGRRIGSATVFVEGSNLLDSRYQEIPGVNMPGRWLRAGVVLEKRERPTLPADAPQARP